MASTLRLSINQIRRGLKNIGMIKSKGPQLKKEWSEAEHLQLHKMKEKGMLPKEMASTFRLSINQIRRGLKKIGMVKSQK